MLYLQYYGLKETPFQDTANPNFFWFGEGQSEAIAILKFGIEKGEGITVLTGDVGIGKTTLAKYLADHLKSKFNTVKIDDSEIESMDFLYFIADSLKLPFNFEDKRSFFQYVDEWLIENNMAEAGDTIVYMVNEANTRASEPNRMVIHTVGGKA